MKKLLLLLVFTITLSSCMTVDSGHKAVREKMGGETDMEKVYEEGMHMGINWLWDSSIEYNVKEQTIVKQFEFNDADDMLTTVLVALDFRLSGKDINKLHKEIDAIEVKIETSLSSAAKEVVPQYSAVDLNKNKRSEAENKLELILKDELSEFYVEFRRVRFTDINIPAGISRLAEQTAVQIGKNELAAKMELEKQNLAKAKVAEAQGNYDAEAINDKTKALRSKPQYLELYNAETERLWAEQGKSKWGTNNVFGSNPTLFKNI